MLTEKTEWQDSWLKNLEIYLSKPPRTANFVKHILRGKVSSVLELGAGSCRDSRALSHEGYDVIASDFEPRTVEMLKNRFSKEKLKIETIDTFNIIKETNSFDLVFHNGLFILFDDEQIKKAIKEQARVAEKYVLILVHNKENEALKKFYKENKHKDRIYEIRFFAKQELESLILASGIVFKKIRFLNFGGFADTFYDQKVKGIKNPFKRFAATLAPMFYRFQKESNTERIACLIEL